MKLTRAQHLRRGADFDAIRAHSFGNVCGAFRLRILTTGNGLRRVGVISSRRIGNAVQRNRARRLLREAFRNSQALLPTSCDVLLIAARNIAGMSSVQVTELFRQQTSRCLRRTTSTTGNA